MILIFKKIASEIDLFISIKEKLESTPNIQFLSQLYVKSE